ncbi:MAG TPA: DNA recombination protein RmuC [Vicinamibacterales bacterium]|nr:DNA recombination protein RmuC [Vicinamibacterales bacterium]
MLFPLAILGVLCAGACVWALLAERRAGRLQALLEAERAVAAQKLAILERARDELKDSFSALSSDALRRNNESFLQLARETLARAQDGAKRDLESRQQEIATLVQPLKESLGRLGEHLQHVDVERAASSRALTEQLRHVVETQERLRHETQSLARALHNPNQRGRWGEVQLRNVLERAGLVEYCDFTEKDSTRDGDGRRLTPDVTVRLPNDACVVIDSKVPIDAYLRALEAKDETQREALLREHGRQVRDHMKALGGKSYWAHFEPAPAFVVMFLPAEPLFSVAFSQDPSLFEFAIDQRVIPATPLTLIALLRTVASAWQQQRLARNAEEIRLLGRDLYERLATMAEHVADVGDHLRRAGAAYDNFIGSLDARVLASARRFKELGVETPKSLPDDLTSTHLDVRQPRAPELRAPVQESLIEAELVSPVAESEPIV